MHVGVMVLLIALVVGTTLLRFGFKLAGCTYEIDGQQVPDEYLRLNDQGDWLQP